MRTINILLICVLLVSCRNTKEIIKSNTDTKTSTEIDFSKDEVTKTDTKIISSIAGNVTETDSTVIAETVTELSKPDSTGKQYPEKVTQRVITTGKNRQTKTIENAQLDQSIENKVNKTEKTAEEKTVSNETDIKTVKKNQSWKIIALIILALTIVVFIVYKLKGDWIKKVINNLRN